MKQTAFLLPTQSSESSYFPLLDYAQEDCQTTLNLNQSIRVNATKCFPHFFACQGYSLVYHYLRSLV